METFLSIFILYILGIVFYTVVVKNSATNKYIKDMKIWPIVWDGAKGMTIGFAVVAALMFVISKILTLIHI